MSDFDALYPEAADTATEARMRRPVVTPETPWFKGFWSAAGKAVPRAGAEMGRAMSSLMTPEAAGALDAPSMFSAPKGRPKADLAEELRQQDSAIRDAIKEFTPNPETTGAASMMLHEVARFGAKAGGYALFGGAPAAVAGMALDEGTNETLRRVDEGVDTATAVKLGVTKGIASGVAVALPVAGSGFAQTVGLAVAGGPGSYIAENLTARQILQSADYTKEAAAIDPFDPLGLGVSFFGSLLFGAGSHAMRGVKTPKQVTGKVGESTITADAETLAAAQAAHAAKDGVVDVTAREVPPGELTPAAQAARAYTPEQVDAAHVAILQHQRESTALHAADDLAASAGHARALDQASEQLAAGRRVEVADVAPVDAARVEAEVAPLLRRVENAVRSIELFHGTKDATVTVDGLAVTKDIGPHFTTERATAELFANSEGTPGRVLEARGSFANPLDLPDLGSWFPTSMAEAIDAAHGVAAGADGQTPLQARVWSVMEAVRKEFLDQQPEWYQKARNDFGKKSPEQVAQEREIQAAANDKANEAGYQMLREHLAEQGYDSIKYINQHEGAPVDTYIALDRSKVRDAAAPEPAPTGDPVTDAITTAARAIEDALKPPETAKPAEPVADFLTREADRIEQADPNMMVMMEGMDGPVPVRELLAEAKAMAEQEMADAPLLQVAAECALRG